jgi:hypothetical protein
VRAEAAQHVDQPIKRHHARILGPPCCADLTPAGVGWVSIVGRWNVEVVS